MKIKSKLAIGTGLLFFLIMSVGVISCIYINKLAGESGKIIQDNYASLEYCRNMQKAINALHLLKSIEMNDSVGLQKNQIEKAKSQFETNLTQEEKNITEYGEKEAASALRSSYLNYLEVFDSPKSGRQDETEIFSHVQERIIDIQNINMSAMNSKNTKAKDTGNKAILYVSFVSVFAFLIALSLSFNLPGIIANPLIEITEKIKEIANKNYDQRIISEGRKDEIGELTIAFNAMAERLQQHEKSNLTEIQTEKSRVESIVRNLNEGIILLDEQKRIKVINPIASELLDLQTSEMLEKYAPDIAMKNDLFRELLKGIDEPDYKNGAPLRITLGNEENFFKKEIFIIQRESSDRKTKETAGYIISLRNITEFKKLDLAKTNFIAIVSHELKTPISSINLSLKLLQDPRIGSLNDEQKNLVESVKDETTRLSKITGELLDISQVETGNIRLSIEEVEPSDIIKYSKDVIKNHIKEKNIEFIEDFSGNLPKVKADLEKTVWVMTNLLVNAVRYTPENGKIRIAIHPSLKEMQFSVEDTGPGIEPKNKERIFQKFIQVDNKKQREGVGLGLAISKEFIQQQGGKIWVESELGVGSKFVFTLLKYL